MPEELRGLPPGRYILEPVIAPPTAGEESGIREALLALNAGKGIPLDEVMRELEDNTEAP